MESSPFLGNQRGTGGRGGLNVLKDCFLKQAGPRSSSGRSDTNNNEEKANILTLR